MSAPRHQSLVDKSIDACIAALEIYNKPDFRYREESFAILMLNAWELLLKARVVKENGGKMRAIEVWEPRRKKDGTKSKIQKRKLNRAGNPMTIGIDRVIGLVREYSKHSIDNRCAENLSLLVEIRDNAIHLLNVSPGLSKRIQEVGSASLKNYVRAAEDWFQVDLGRYNFYLMPLAFHSPADIIESLRSHNQPQAARNLLRRIAEVERENASDKETDYNVTMQVQLQFVRNSGSNALPVQISQDDPNAVIVKVSEEDVLKAFPWDYAELTRRLVERYSDFLQNSRYHNIRKPLENDDRYCRVRALDPTKPDRGPRKRFYNANIISEFDKHYARK